MINIRGKKVYLFCIKLNSKLACKKNCSNNYYKPISEKNYVFLYYLINNAYYYQNRSVNIVIEKNLLEFD